MSGCNRGPLRPDGKRPDWHKRDYPWLDDEDWNRPLTPDEWGKKLDDYTERRQTLWIVFVIVMIVIGSVDWGKLEQRGYPTPHEQQQGGAR